MDSGGIWLSTAHKANVICMLYNLFSITLKNYTNIFFVLHSVAEFIALIKIDPILSTPNGIVFTIRYLPL